MFRLHIINKSRATAVAVFFGTLFFLGLIGYRTVGISADEPALYTAGVQEYAYLFMDGPVPAVQDWAFHNPFVHMTFFGVQRWLGIEAAQPIWMMRHFLMFTLFIVAAYALFRIAEELWDDWGFALIPAAVFVLSPRIFLHGFHNPKDIPALVFFTLSVLTLIRYRQSTYSWKWLLPHAIVCGLSISLRMFGGIVIVLTLLAMALDFIILKRGDFRNNAKNMCIFLCVFAISQLLVWPVLWEGPIQHFLNAFRDNTERSSSGLFMGENITVLPWYYLPVWIAITTPLLYTALFVVGTVHSLLIWIRKPALLVTQDFLWLCVFAWLGIPYFVLVVFRIGIFDEWRHMLFIYPAFVLIACRGLQALWNMHSIWIRRLTTFLVAVSLGWTGIWMLLNHPHGYAYFSIPSRFVDGNFELDYWGLSYREGIQWVLEHDSREQVPVYTASRAGYVSGDLFPYSEWQRLRFVSAASADYILDNFRWNKYKQALPAERLLYGVKVDGLLVHGVYKGPESTGLFQKHTE